MHPSSNPTSRHSVASTESLLTFLQSITPLSNEVLAYVAENSYTVKAHRNTFLLKPGEVCDNYYFLEKGLLRAYIRFGSKEVTTWLVTEGNLVTSIRSLVQQKQSLEHIHALEDCQLICMPHKVVNYLYENFPEVNRLGRIILEHYYADAEERAFISRIPNATARYDHFVNSRPDLANRVPLKYVASFLGMTEETLSRLRAKKASGG